MHEAILKRTSRRCFLDAPISPEQVGAIRAAIETLNRESGLTVEYLPDAATAFASRRKTYGMFSGVRAVVVLKGPTDAPDLAERIGYYGERLVLDITDLGLGTCWVAGTFDRKQFAIAPTETLLCVIPVGAVAARSAKEELIHNVISRRRKPARSRMTGYDAAPEWARQAMEAVRLAPSAANSQKPQFRYAGGVVTAAVPDQRPVDLVDLGIAKLHFALEAGGSFELGQNGRFIRSEVSD